jgi:hypothetical protein
MKFSARDYANSITTIFFLDILEMQQFDKELQQLAMTLLVSIGQLSKMVPFET